MKKLILLVLLSLSLFAEGSDRTDIPYVDADLIEQSEAYDVLCIRGYEYIVDSNGSIHQSFGDYLGTSVPIKCSKKKEVK